MDPLLVMKAVDNVEVEEVIIPILPQEEDEEDDNNREEEDNNNFTVAFVEEVMVGVEDAV